MHDVIQNPVRYDSEKGIWILEGFGGIAYSDGAEAEHYVLKCVREAGDLSSTSDELAGKARDWPSEYHLSTRRSQLLRGFQMDPGASALEIGCGCGAVTRLLGERLETVHAVEGSVLRAQIAAARCRDLENVQVVAAPFQDLRIARRYDLVFCIGVLEYSRMFIEADDPVQACLEFLKDMVAPNGRLVLAIENQFGLQYFSGCVEDHTGVPFDGIEGYASQGELGPVTFGRTEMEDRLKDAGFDNSHFYLAFPDYKLPECLIDGEVASRSRANLGGLVRRLPKPSRGHSVREHFCDALAWWELGRNRALPTFSPSFLVMAGGPPNEGPIRADWQALLFTMSRRPAFRTLTSFHELDTDSPAVRKLAAVEGAASPVGLSIHRDTAPFIKGTPFDIRMLKAARSRTQQLGHFLSEVELWAASLWAFVLERVSAQDLTGLPSPNQLLSGRALDAAPWNALISDDGVVNYIDLEWELPEAIPLHYVVARSLLHFVESNPTTGSRLMSSETSMESWIDDCFRALWPDETVDWKGSFVSRESDFMEQVTGAPAVYNAAYYVRRLGAQGTSGDASPEASTAPPVQDKRASASLSVSPAMTPAQPHKESGIDVTIVIPVFNNLNYTKACLESVFAHTDGVSHEVVVVDNASTDGTRAYLESLGDRIRPLYNDHNAGFAGANNQATAVARGRYVLYLNNDTEARTGWLQAMVRVMEKDSSAAIVGSKLLYPDGTIQHAGMAFTDGCNPIHVYRGGDLARHAIVNRQREMQTVTGGCLMLRRGVVEEPEVFDEVFINGCEDVDLCLRVRELGHKVIYCPESELVHHESKTQGRATYDVCNYKILKQRWDRRVTPDIQQVMAQDGIQAAPGASDQWSWSQDRMQPVQPPPALKPAWRQPLDPHLTVIVPVKDARVEVEGLLQRILATSGDVPMEIIVVDNGSTDATLAFVEQVTDDTVSVIPGGAELGLGGSVAVAARISRGRVLMVAGLSLAPEDGWLQPILDHVASRPDQASRVDQGGLAAVVFSPSVFDPARTAGSRTLADLAEAVGGADVLTLDEGSADANGSAHVSAETGVVWQAPIYDPSGYADEARNFLLGLEHSGIQVTASAIGERDSETFRQELDDMTRKQLDTIISRPIRGPVISVIHFPAYVFERVPGAAYHVGRVMFESDGLPKDWVEKCNLMDEIWVPTEFNLETFRKAGVTTKLMKVPGGMDSQKFRPGLAPLELTGVRGFVFLSIFEWTLRKGWDVLLRSWSEAFGPDDDVSLVLRAYPQNQVEGSATAEIERRIDRFLLEQLGKRRDEVAPIVVLGQQLSDGDIPRLYAAADAYVAPSRGEGWGRPHMEAMASGLPVIATRWSGNTEFMTDENSYLIDVERMVDGVEATQLSYYTGKMAEPSREHLTQLMRGVCERKDEARRIGERARADVVEKWSWDRAVDVVVERLGEISASLAAPPADRAEAGEAETPVRVRWEGSQFVTHSLAHVNREISLKLMEAEGVDLSLVPYETHEFGPEADPRFSAIQAHLNRPLDGPVDVHVRHQWPPNFTPPEQGRWVLVQPWEFGHIPRAWVKPIVDGVDEVWAYTSFVKQCYVDSGVPADRVHVVSLGVDVEQFHPGADPIALQTQKRFKFLFVGGTIYRKGIDVLLDAYEKAFTHDDDVCLVIKDMGQSSFYKNQNAGDRIREVQQNPEAPEIVYLTETIPVDRMAGIYTAADCLVHPYRGEGFGLPVAEAMACGLPVVVTKGGACDDFCSEETAYLVPSTRREIGFEEETAGPAWLLEPDGDALVSRMREVMGDPDAAHRKGKLALETILSAYTWTHSAQRASERLKEISERPIRRINAETDKVQTTSSDNGSPVVHPPVEESEAEETPVDVLVVPGGPGGDRDAASRQLEQFTGSPIRLISVNPGNDPVSLSTLVNSIVQAVECDFVALVRDDVRVTDQWVNRLLKHIKDDPTVGLVVPRVPVGTGKQHVSPTYGDLDEGLQAFSESIRRETAAEPESLSVIAGGCLLIRSGALRALGGLDGTFSTWAAVDDLSRRLRQLGFRSVVAPEVFVHCNDLDAGTPDAEMEARERWAVEQLDVGDEHRVSGEHEEAIARYRDALAAKDDYLEVRLVLSAALLEQGAPDEAVELLREMEGKHPDSSRVKNYLGRCLFQAGTVEEAERSFEEALELDEAFAEAHSNLGVLYWESGRLDKALERLTRAAELTPDHPDVVYNVAMVYAQLGQTKEALETLRVYVTLDPGDLNARVYLAVLLLENDAVSDGLTELEHVLSVDPGHAEAVRVIGQLQEAVSVGEGDPSDLNSEGGVLPGES